MAMLFKLPDAQNKQNHGSKLGEYPEYARPMCRIAWRGRFENKEEAADENQYRQRNQHQGIAAVRRMDVDGWIHDDLSVFKFELLLSWRGNLALPW